jgi:predicted RNase H-like nuclease (RuvC/YqgF family)
MIDRGELEAHQDERGRHLIAKRAVRAMLEERRAAGVGETSTEETSRRSAEETRELRERVEGLQRELGCLEGRLELTEKTESTIREERERLERGYMERATRPAGMLTWWTKVRKPTPWRRPRGS